ncbi:MAG TPA: hypothetical protein VIL97_10815 [Thermoanaerobaculia bacterium]
MGPVTWLAAGIAAFLLGRRIERARPDASRSELIVALIASLLAGIAATALDFGGWNEVEWRVALFAALIASAAIAISRLSTTSGIRRP